MATLAEIRKKYPEYNDLSDQQLADGFYNKYYSDMPKEEFYKKIQFTPPQPVKPNLIQRIDKSAPVQGILGAGDATRDFFANAYNLVVPKKVQIPQNMLAPTGDENATSYKIGKFGGNVGTFIGGGEALDTLRAAKALQGMKAIQEGVNPTLLQKGAAYLDSGVVPSAAKRALGSAAYGAISDPENRIKGALVGSAGSILPEMVIGTGGKAIQAFSPGKTVSAILEDLGNNKTIEQNGKDFAQKIKNAYDTHAQNASDLYQPVNEKVGSKSMADLIDVKNSPYASLLEKDSLGDPGIKKLHNNFMGNPTFDNAHKLQSEYGYEIRDLQAQKDKGQLDTLGKDRLKNHMVNRDNLKNLMQNYLVRADQDLIPQYEKASQYFYDNIGPYRNNKDIMEIASGSNMNPKNIHSLFEYPGKDTLKIAEDVGPDAARHILYPQLKDAFKNENSNTFLSKLNDLKQKGYGSYISPDLEEMGQRVASQLRNKSILQKVAPFALGAAGGHGLASAASLPLAADVGLSALSGLSTSAASKKALSGGAPGATSLMTRAADMGKSLPRLTAKAILANILNGGV